MWPWWLCSGQCGLVTIPAFRGGSNCHKANQTRVTPVHFLGLAKTCKVLLTSEPIKTFNMAPELAWWLAS